VAAVWLQAVSSCPPTCTMSGMPSPASGSGRSSFSAPSTSSEAMSQPTRVPLLITYLP
jgi:hypothetical protein